MTDYVITAPGMDKAEIKQAVSEMNLELNFVNNHNLRIGNLDTAYRAFREVVERHPGQPFAQYFLGKTLIEMGAPPAHAEAHFLKYREIIASSAIWRDAAEKFGLQFYPDHTPHQAPRQAAQQSAVAVERPIHAQL